MPLSLVRASLLLVLVSILASGCERIAEKSEEERRIEVEQNAIETYSKRIPEVDKLQATFAREWKNANELTDIKAFRQAISTEVIPALKRYVAAIEAIPLDSDRLEEIHSGMVEAYGGTVTAFEAFVKELNEENLTERYKEFMEHMETVAKADSAYRAALQEYYTTNRVRLVQAATEKK